MQCDGDKSNHTANHTKHIIILQIIVIVYMLVQI